jgi:hypothetical protein
MKRIGTIGRNTFPTDLIKIDDKSSIASIKDALQHFSSRVLDFLVTAIKATPKEGGLGLDDSPYFENGGTLQSSDGTENSPSVSSLRTVLNEATARHIQNQFFQELGVELPKDKPEAAARGILSKPKERSKATKGGGRVGTWQEEIYSDDKRKANREKVWNALEKALHGCEIWTDSRPEASDRLEYCKFGADEHPEWEKNEKDQIEAPFGDGFGTPSEDKTKTQLRDTLLRPLFHRILSKYF